MCTGLINAAGEDSPTKTDKRLDISTVPTMSIAFSWLSCVCAKNKIETLIVSEEQHRYLFSNGEDKWTYYRGCLLQVSEPKIT